MFQFASDERNQLYSLIHATFILQMQPKFGEKNGYIVINILCVSFGWMHEFRVDFHHFFFLSFVSSLSCKCASVFCRVYGLQTRKGKMSFIVKHITLMADTDKQITIYWSIGHAQNLHQNLAERIPWLQSWRSIHYYCRRRRRYRLSSTNKLDRP